MSRDCLYMLYKGPDVSLCSSLSTLGAAPSGPVDLFGFSLRSFFSISSCVNLMSDNAISVREAKFSGMLSVSSRVNTEEKKSLRVLAFCISDLVRVPSSVSSCAIPGLVFNLDLAYLKKAFGFCLHSFASFLSNSRAALPLNLVPCFSVTLVVMASSCASPGREGPILCRDFTSRMCSHIYWSTSSVPWLRLRDVFIH